MIRNSNRAVVTVAAAVMAGMGAILVLAGPAAAIGIDPSPVRNITWPRVDGQETDALAVAADGTIWVSEDNARGSKTTGALVAFAPGLSGARVPDRVIVGPDTGLTTPYGVAIDASGNIWTADVHAGKVFEFAADADGDQAPINTIDISVGKPEAIAIGADGTIYVADKTAVLEYAPGATGIDPPINSIDGLTSAGGIAIQKDGTIFVGDYDNGEIDTFAAGATGNASPIYRVVGPQTRLSPGFPPPVAVDPSGDIYFVDYTEITEYAKDANGDQPPIAAITGLVTSQSGIVGVAVDSTGLVYAGLFPEGANDPNAITVFSPEPSIASITPATGPVSGGQTVTIHGPAFIAPILGVTFGGVAATDVTLVNPTTITAVVPPGVAGAVDVTVTQGDGTQSATLTGGYTYVPTLATTGVDPTLGITAGAILLAIGAVLLVVRRRFAPTRRSARQKA